MSWSLGLFIDAGGKPSGSYHSSYSKICKQLQLVDDQEVTESYQNTSYREEIRKLHTLVCRFHPNDDGSTGVKLKQILAVRNLKIYIENSIFEQRKTSFLEQGKVSELLDKMAKNPMKLISNTGTGLRAVFSRGTLGMKFVKGTLDNAAWSGTHMKFDVTRIWQNENLAIGVLLHEYHHFLIKADQKRKYADEFVAHWKQYLAMNDKRTAEQKVAHINHWLLDDPNGYKLRGNGPLRISDENATDESGKFNGTEFTGPADAGVIWTRYEHNV